MNTQPIVVLQLIQWWIYISVFIYIRTLDEDDNNLILLALTLTKE